ncbi:MAG: BrnT family toxin [Gemmatimonadaceae bacterium]
MRFTWDPDKSQLNLRDRGFDFAFATLIFDGPTLERVDYRQDYGETRVVAIGIADGIPLTVVYTDRAEGEDLVRRIISARVSNRRERKAYRQVIE